MLYPFSALLYTMLTQDISGVGQAMWQVVLGRVISGAGASGMAGLVSILITGRSLEIKEKITKAD